MKKFEKEGEKGVSYADIAKKAWEAGRTKLATMVSIKLLSILELTSSCSTTRCVRPSKSHFYCR